MDVPLDLVSVEIESLKDLDEGFLFCAFFFKWEETLSMSSINILLFLEGMLDDFLVTFEGFLRGEFKRVVGSMRLPEEESLLGGGLLGSLGGLSFGPLPDC